MLLGSTSFDCFQRGFVFKMGQKVSEGQPQPVMLLNTLDGVFSFDRKQKVKVPY